MNLAEEFDRLVLALDSAGVSYALVGGLAVAVWGVPRATKDIDLLVLPETLDRARGVARSLGFTLEAKPLRFSDGMEIRRMTKVSDGSHLILDLMLVDENSSFAWKERVRVPVLKGQIWVVSRDALIDMKTRAGRPQDLADVEKLLELDR